MKNCMVFLSFHLYVHYIMAACILLAHDYKEWDVSMKFVEFWGKSQHASRYEVLHTIKIRFNKKLLFVPAKPECVCDGEGTMAVW